MKDMQKITVSRKYVDKAPAASLIFAHKWRLPPCGTSKKRQSRDLLLASHRQDVVTDASSDNNVFPFVQIEET